MPPTFTIEQYTTLKAAIALGATDVFYGDKKVSYRSLAEMWQLLHAMEGELFPVDPAIAGNRRRRYVEFGKGLNGCTNSNNGWHEV